MNWIKILKSSLLNFVLTILSVSFVLGALELSLRVGLFDDSDNPGPVWIPPKFKKIDQGILAENEDFALNNPFWFTDIVRIPHKEEGKTRIAVLGDSFVWGDGLPYEKVWSHKLERMIEESYPNVEVLHWGRNGWNTADELEFLTRFGRDYNIDYLIVGFVTNDPDLNNTSRDKDFLKWHKSETFKMLKKVLPLTSDFLAAHINNLLMKYIYSEQATGKWIDDLYATDNLKLYKKTLRALSDYCQGQNIPLLFVLTPRNYSELIRQKYEIISPLLEDAGIEYLNLLSKVKSSFEGVNIRHLWANPANGHPGEEVTVLFAEEVFKYIRESWFFEKNNFVPTYTDPLEGLSESSTECDLWIKKVGSEVNPEITRPIEIEKANYVFIEGNAGQYNNRKPVKSVFLRINGSILIEAAMGPFYEVYKFIPEKTEYKMVPDSWFTFKIHVPEHFFKRGKNRVEFVLLRNDRNAYLVHPVKLEIDFLE